MPLRQLMTAEELRQWILRRLGAPILKVELTECHLDDVIAEAKEWFNAKKGVIKRALMRLTPNQSEYPIPDEMDTVVEVVFPSQPFDFSMIYSPFILLDEKVPYDVFAAPFSAGLYSTFTQTLQYVEMAKRIVGAEWEWRQENRTLVLAPTPKDPSGAIFIYYKTYVEAIEQLNARDFDLLKRYALALAKRDLGRIRSKYDSFPTAAGTTTLDGERLLQEAADEIEKLDEELAQSGYPMGFLTG